MENIKYGSFDLTPEQIAAQEMAKDKIQEKSEDREAILTAKRARRNLRSAEGIDDPLHVPPHMLRPGFKYFWGADKPGRINDLILEGYEHVTDKDIAEYCGCKDGEPVRRPSGQHDPAWLYLMRIETELWKETLDRRNNDAKKVLEGVNQIGEGLSFQKQASVTGVDLDKRNALDNDGY